MGYKSLAQIPARRNGPVSYDVRPHNSKTVFLRLQGLQTTPSVFHILHGKRPDGSHKNHALSSFVDPTINTESVMTGLAFVVVPRKSFQFGVGASRRRAAPRSQPFGAAQVALCHFIGYRRPLIICVAVADFSHKMLRHLP